MKRAMRGLTAAAATAVLADGLVVALPGTASTNGYGLHVQELEDRQLRLLCLPAHRLPQPRSDFPNPAANGIRSPSGGGAASASATGRA